MENEYGKCRVMEIGNSSGSKKSHKGRKREKNGSSVEMDSRIWENLPEDVLEGVIARLPIVSFFRFRLVCQKWNSFLHSQGFLRRWAAVGKRQPLFYTLTSEFANIGAMYDPVMKKWHGFNTLLSGGFYPCASAGGLVCYLRRDPRSIYVCNPLTKTWKELPPGSFRPNGNCAVGMVLNQNPITGGYRIFWVTRKGAYNVYDSLNNSWQLSSEGILANVQLPLIFDYTEVTVSIDTKVYFCRRYDPHGIVSYDVVTREWEQLLIQPPPNSTDLALAECEGRILLMGQVRQDEATSVYVWELERTMLTWVKLDRMPTSWCLEFNRKSMDLICLGNKGLLMMLLKWNDIMNRVFTYDVRSREWSKVPRRVLSGENTRQLINSGTIFFPCLITSP